MSDRDLAAAVGEALALRQGETLIVAYLFGSAVEGGLRADSDLDIAFLGPRCEAPAKVFDAAQALAARLQRDVDLIDLATASTVMQARIVGYGRRIHLGDRYRAELFEMQALSDYARLQEERAKAVGAFTAAYDDGRRPPQ